MRHIVLLVLIFILSTAASAATQLPKEIEGQISNFFTPLHAEGALLSFDKVWGNLDFSKDGEGQKLKDAIQKHGKLISHKLVKRHEGAAARLIRLIYDLKLNSGHRVTCEFLYIHRLSAPYSLYDIKISN